jgi:hypothetical protein
MKTLKFAALGLIALGSAHMASAVTVYITGSSAYRGATQTAIMKLLGSTNGTSFGNATIGTFGYTGTSGLNSANAAIFKGSYGGSPIIIKTSWSGSAAGIQTVGATNNNFTVGFLVDGTTTTSAGTNNATDPRAKGNGTDVHVPDIAMSDVYQGSTNFQGTFNSVAYSNLTDNVVGVVAFRFVKSKGAASGITNMTPQLAQATWIGLGTCPLALYTGNSTDQGTLVRATGRDADSGTRITAFAESGIGAFTAVQQYDTASEALYAAQTINGISFALGEGGESSGGTLAGTTKMGKTGLTNSYVSYMSTGDAATLVGNGGSTLTYNGVDYTLNAVQQGQYTFWGYEHLFYKDSLAGTALSFATDLTGQITSVDGTVLLGSMKVVRGQDGGVVTADY